MGAPELPGDPGEEDLHPTQPIQHPALPSDDNSDNEALDTYGYQPLAMNDELDAEADLEIDNNRLMDDEHVESFVQQRHGPTTPMREEEADNFDDAEVTHGDSNLPQIESVDTEIERQVWNEPRPRELQLDLDNARTTQILNAMANFALPNVAVPDWAAGVPEERWKEELLQRIRQRKEPSPTNRSDSAKVD